MRIANLQGMQHLSIETAAGTLLLQINANGCIEIDDEALGDGMNRLVVKVNNKWINQPWVLACRVEMDWGGFWIFWVQNGGWTSNPESEEIWVGSRTEALQLETKIVDPLQLKVRPISWLDIIK